MSKTKRDSIYVLAFSNYLILFVTIVNKIRNLFFNIKPYLSFDTLEVDLYDIGVIVKISLRQ